MGADLRFSRGSAPVEGTRIDEGVEPSKGSRARSTRLRWNARLRGLYRFVPRFEPLRALAAGPLFGFRLGLGPWPSVDRLPGPV